MSGLADEDAVQLDLAAADFNAEDLLEFAKRQRGAAAMTDSAGQKRALLRIADV